MDSDELIGQGYTPQWVQEQHARMQAPYQADAEPEKKLRDRIVADLFAAVPLTELGMYGQSMDGQYGWCICSLCQKPVGGPDVGYSRDLAAEALIEHLRIAHGARQ